jgi:acetoin utilization deacetylase AcuC-like enzyme
MLAPMEERWFTDPRCLEHRSPPGYPEQPERLATLLAMAKERGFALDQGFIQDTGANAVVAPVEALHDPAYVERFRAAVARGDGVLDSADNPLSAATWDAAWGAVEAAVRGADWLVAGTARHAFAAVRPPGHHAEVDTAMGFCFFGNIALAAEHLVRRHGLERVAIVDFDVHHGNGTQHLLETRGDVLFISLHQAPFYPGTGARDERGEGDGEGATCNVPLPAGTGDEGYARAFAEEVVPALDRHRPQAILVSAGFDAWKHDPLGGMAVTEAGFHHWGEVLAAAADRLCDGRMLSALEGGYDTDRLADLAAAYLDGAAGRPRAEA